MLRSIAATVALLATPTGAVAQVMHRSCPQITLGVQHVGASPVMTFAVRKVNKRRVLMAEGGITAATPAALAGALAADRKIDEIWVRSAGGDAIAGNKAAEIVRKSGLPIRVPAGWWCISACNFLFFGGALRTIDPGGQFGVHMATTVNSAQSQAEALAMAKTQNASSILERIAANEQATAMLTAWDIDVVLRMGISRKLLSEVMYAQRADEFRDEDNDGQYDFGKVARFRCLTQAEMRKYNVINVD